ncbi:hypothetical protein CLU79DRAFT_750714 [Phycomyces nitens]|nr:hypothetical protein CLU79DRAFT_750714 [Phycomyces nitens]
MNYVAGAEQFYLEALGSHAQYPTQQLFKGDNAMGSMEVKEYVKPDTASCMRVMSIKRNYTHYLSQDKMG